MVFGTAEPVQTITQAAPISTAQNWASYRLATSTTSPGSTTVSIVSGLAAPMTTLPVCTHPSGSPVTMVPFSVSRMFR